MPIELQLTFLLTALALAIWEGYKHEIKARLKALVLAARWVHASRGK